MYIIIRTGPEAGTSFKLKAGIKLGRKKADFIVKDVSASGHHATIQEANPNEFYLVDNKSKNGTKINGVRTDFIELLEGTKFTIGETEFEIVNNLQNLDEEKPEGLHEDQIVNPTPPQQMQNAAEPPAGLKAPDPTLIEIDIEYHWNEHLEEFSRINMKKIKNRPKPVKAFDPALKLTFVRGVQSDSSWTLGYGPRSVGSHEYDLTIFEPDAPALCFELLPDKKGVKFKTTHTKQVLLNGKSKKSAILSEGDEISINNSIIKVNLIP